MELPINIQINGIYFCELPLYSLLKEDNWYNRRKEDYDRYVLGLKIFRIIRFRFGWTEYEQNSEKRFINSIFLTDTLHKISDISNFGNKEWQQNSSYEFSNMESILYSESQKSRYLKHDRGSDILQIKNPNKFRFVFNNHISEFEFDRFNSQLTQTKKFSSGSTEMNVLQFISLKNFTDRSSYYKKDIKFSKWA
jgi:hypothetical protein